MIGSTVFLSHRGDEYNEARQISDWLQSTGYCHRAVGFPPESLSAGRELLMPFEFVELYDHIWSNLVNCNAFAYYSTSHYLASFWTQMEITGWRRFTDQPTVYAISKNGGSYAIARHDLNPMPLNEKKLWANISVSHGRRFRGKWMPVAPTGRFGRNAYLCPCTVTGEYYLAKKSLVESLSKSDSVLPCPICTKRHGRTLGHSLTRIRGGGHFKRDPIRFKEDNPAIYRTLLADELLRLLIYNDPPSGIEVIGF